MGEVAPVRRRMLGAALRRYRVQRGLSLDDAARMLGCDPSKVSRIENGLRGLRGRDLAVLLAEYGTGPGERAGLLALAGPRAGEGWWQAYAGMLPAAVVEYAGLEAAASRLLVYEPQRVPALARSGGYSRAVAGHDPAAPAGTAEAVAEFTALRQQAVLGSAHRELVMVIGEAALRQRAGGTGVMRSQLERLARLSMQDGPLAVHVLPFASGAHVGAGSGPFTVFGFDQAPGLGVVHLDSVTGGVFLDSPADLAAATFAFTRLTASALSREESAHFLGRMARR
jgi:transcriptional regulator with XRE-family HTH domain